MNAPNRLELKALGKTFGGLAALDGVDLRLEPGEIVGLTGPSGAGKTTTCRLIAGVERPSSGEVWLAGARIDGLSPQDRTVAMMFESYALYPMMSVYENIAFPLLAPTRGTDTDPRRIAARIEEVLALTELTALRERMPHELSGGQKQRVALCRALVQEPRALLLDEPISHLDAKLRHRLRGDIRRRLVSADAPVLWCTPDAMEALSVADRVAVLVDGVLQQVDTPEAVYARPANMQVARLIGDPAMNLLRGRLTRRDGRIAFAHEAVTVPLSDAIRARIEGRGGGEDLVLGVRATDVEVAAPGAHDDGAVTCEVYTFEPFGKYSIVTARLGGDTFKAKTFEPVEFETGDVVSVRFPAADFVLFDAGTGATV